MKTTQGLVVQRVGKGSDPALKRSFHQDLTEPNCMACHSDHAGPRLTLCRRKVFSHTVLREDVRIRCDPCHKAPSNDMHRNLGTACAQCHQTQAWKPATFEHDKFFVLDADHNAPCQTCHLVDDKRTYTCYGCHEHTLANVRRKHVKEGISNFENCVRCHRSAEDEPEGQGERGERD